MFPQRRPIHLMTPCQHREGMLPFPNCYYPAAWKGRLLSSTLTERDRLQKYQSGSQSVLQLCGFTQMTVRCTLLVLSKSMNILSNDQIACRFYYLSGNTLQRTPVDCHSYSYTGISDICRFCRSTIKYRSLRNMG